MWHSPPMGRHVASAGDDHAVRLWNVNEETELSTLAGHKSLVMSVVYTPDGRSLVTGGFDGPCSGMGCSSRHVY